MSQPTRKAPIGVTPAARLLDQAGRWAITVGGVGVIAAVLGIFVFVLGEAYPLFKDAQVHPRDELVLTGTEDVLATGSDPYLEIAFVVHTNGVSFYRIADGEAVSQVVPSGLHGARLTVADASVENGFFGLGTSDGRVLGVQIGFKVTFSADRREILPELVEVDEHRLFDGVPVRLVSYRDDGAGVSVVFAADEADGVAYS